MTNIYLPVPKDWFVTNLLISLKELSSAITSIAFPITHLKPLEIVGSSAIFIKVPPTGSPLNQGTLSNLMIASRNPVFVTFGSHFINVGEAFFHTVLFLGSSW